MNLDPCWGVHDVWKIQCRESKAILETAFSPRTIASLTWTQNSLSEAVLGKGFKFLRSRLAMRLSRGTMGRGCMG